MTKEEKYYEEMRKAGLTDAITSNPEPNYKEPFYQNIFSLMAGYSSQIAIEAIRLKAAYEDSLNMQKASNAGYESKISELTTEVTRLRESLATVQKIIQKPEPISKSELICAIHPALNPSLSTTKCAICYCDIINDIDGLCAECWSKK